MENLVLLNCKNEADIVLMKEKYSMPEEVQIDLKNDIYKCLTTDVFPEANDNESMVRTFISSKRSLIDQK